MSGRKAMGRHSPPVNIQEEMETDDSVPEPRGDNGQEGHWLTLDEALAETLGQEAWWELAELNERRVEVKQHDPNGPADKPIFRWSNGDMYLGPWSMSQDPHKTWPVEEGFGVFYFNYPDAIRGRINICERIEQGFLNGYGKELWLDKAPSWKRNIINRNYTNIRRSVDGRDGYRPLIYEGEFKMDQKHDPQGKVILKDGTCRVGPWEKDKHVGMWKSHQLVELFPSSEPNEATEEIKATAKEEPPMENERAVGKARKRKTSSARSKSKSKRKMESRRSMLDTNKKLPLERLEDKAGNEVAHQKEAKGNEEEGNIAASHEDNQPDQLVAPPKVITLLNSQISSGPDHEDIMDDPQIVQMIARVRDWLCTDKAIGFGAAPKEMERYAEHFFREGLHSPEMIVALCKAPEYLSRFRWMKHSHKQAYQFHREFMDNEKDQK